MTAAHVLQCSLRAMEVGGNRDELAHPADRPVVDYSPTLSRHSVVIFIVDNLLSFVIIGPLVVCYWRGTWELLNVYLFADDQRASGLTCSVIGNVGLLCLVYVQNPLASRIRVENPLHWVFASHIYTYAFGALNVFQWRGLWVLLDHYTGVSVASSWTTFAIGK